VLELEVVWQSDSPNLSTAVPIPAYQPSRSLRDQALTALVDSTLETDSFQISVFDEAKTIPHFPVLLQQLLRERSERLGKSRSAGQLLGLAFEGKAHLDLVRFKGLSAEAIGASLEAAELKNVRSISLCIDTIRSTPTQIMDALSRSSSLRDLYFHQSPTRAKDEPSTELFLELSTRPQLLRGKVTITAAYSAALTKKSWLPPTVNYRPPFEIFPIQHMFYRFESRLMHYYIGDGLLRPERFAAGFLKWLCAPDYFLFAFAAGPPGLEDMSRAEISPIPAENFANRTRPQLPGYDYNHHAEFWPKVRDLVPESWTVLVLREKYCDRERNLQNRRMGLVHEPARALFVNYAFVRPRVHIFVDDPLVIANLKPKELEVGGLKEFLQATAPDVDAALVDKRLAAFGEQIAKQFGEAPLGPGMERLSVLGQDEACALLKNFLHTALQGKQKQLVIRERPQGEFL
jgi:hypothetical protein